MWNKLLLLARWLNFEALGHFVPFSNTNQPFTDRRKIYIVRTNIFKNFVQALYCPLAHNRLKMTDRQTVGQPCFIVSTCIFLYILEFCDVFSLFGLWVSFDVLSEKHNYIKSISFNKLTAVSSSWSAKTLKTGMCFPTCCLFIYFLFINLN